MSGDEARRRLADLRRLLRDAEYRKRMRAEGASLARDPEYQARLAQEIEALDRGERPAVPEPLRAKHWEN